MVSWLRIHQLVPLVVLTLALATIGPALRGFSSAIEAPLVLLPEMVLSPIVLASAIGYAVSTPMSELERSARRGKPALLAAYSLMTTVSLAGLLTLASATIGGGMNPGFSIVRNVASLTGVALISAAFLDGRRAFILPTILGLLTASVARPDSPGPLGWWLLGTDTDLASWAVMLVLLGTGVAALLKRTPVSR